MRGAPYTALRSGKGALLSVEKVGISFGALRALDEFSMDVDTGETVALVGPNGAGKTSLLNCINRIYDYDHGHICLSGQAVDNKRSDQVARLGIGRTFQAATTFNDMLVGDLVMLGRHNFLRHSSLAYAVGLPALRRAELPHREACREILNMLSIGYTERRRLNQLPYGVSKRVDLARALAQKPKLLLLDEPASGLSQSERQSMSDLLNEIRDKMSLTMIVVEHDMNFVRQICDRMVVLQAGTKIADGSCSEVFADQRVVEAFLGEEHE
jgi:branched-chain amino acid transport system ATP-binding protein